MGSNFSGPHAIAVGVNVLNNWILKHVIESDAWITTSNHPLPLTNRQEKITSQVTGFFVGLYLTIAFCFIPAGSNFLLLIFSNLNNYFLLIFFFEHWQCF